MVVVKESLGAWILSIGNELLIGRVVNTNASWIARRLTFLGIGVRRIIVVPDAIDDIVNEIKRGLQDSGTKIIITTGGLGPTYDDITLEAVSKATNRGLVLYESALEEIRKKYEQANMEMTKEREKMAYLPQGSIPLPNPVGIAPGSWLEINGKIVISLPGVPREMEAIFEDYVMERIKGTSNMMVVECGFKVVGIPESSIAPALEEADKRFAGIYIKSHPKGHETKGPILEIKVLASGSSKDEALNKAKGALNLVRERIKGLEGKASEEYCS